MKVLYLIPPGASPDHPTSWGVHMREIIAGLRRCGATVRTLHGYVVPEDALCRPLSATDRRGPLRRFVRGAARDARRLVVSYTLARKGLRLIRENRPDIIYERADFMWLTGWLLARWSGLPRVVETNGLYSDSRGHGWHHVSDRFARDLQRIKTACADRVIVVSRAMKEDLAGIGVPADKIVVQHNGAPGRARPVDPRAVSALRDQLGLRKGIVCGFVGYFLLAHGVDLLVRAAARVNRTADLTVLVVGASRIIDQLRDLASALGLSEKVIFTGPVPPARVPAYLACMDICAIARHGRRNSPLKLFEFGMAGKPIIAPTTAAILEVWKPGVHGIGIRNGNVDDLAEAILTYVRNPGLRERHGRAFQRKVLAEHTWARVAERTAEVLRDVIAARTASGTLTVGA